MKLAPWLQEFRPTILFLVKFVLLYVAANLVYGFFITSFAPSPDPVTIWVTRQSSGLLNIFGWDTHTSDQVATATTHVIHQSKAIIAVYEGCNGINVMIIFVVFLVSFGPMSKKLLWFLPLGLLIIHFVNLLRVSLLFVVAVRMPDFLYFMHKYFFTGIIYLVVFFSWVWWVMRLNRVNRNEQAI